VILSTWISDQVTEAYKRAVTTLPEDIRQAIEDALERETNSVARWGLEIIIRNIQVAKEKGLPICQDTGLPEFFVGMGTGVCIDGNIEEAIREGVIRITRSFPLIPLSVHPVTRANTMDNTGDHVPLIHYSFVPGADYLELTAVPGCAAPQTFSALKMYPAGTTLSDVKGFIYDTVCGITGAVCPPLVLGVGLGGLFGTATMLARRAAVRPLSERHPDPEIAKLEQELLESINTLGIGQMNLGGDTTALAVNIETGHTHAPCLPVAVQIQCWACRRATVRIYGDGRVNPLR
jgi:tartrate/fumarate subfamily iron-sulfur-dependent hydro-lyase alpha chain